MVQSIKAKILWSERKAISLCVGYAPKNKNNQMEMTNA